MLNIAEILRHCKTCQGDAHTSARRFIHLSVNKSRLVDNAGLRHFAPKVIAFARTFADASKDGITAVLRRDVMNELHDENRLADTSAAEETCLAALRVRCNEINDLDARLQNACRRLLILKGRC